MLVKKYAQEPNLDSVKSMVHKQVRIKVDRSESEIKFKEMKANLEKAKSQIAKKMMTQQVNKPP